LCINLILVIIGLVCVLKIVKIIIIYNIYTVGNLFISIDFNNYKLNEKIKFI